MNFNCPKHGQIPYVLADGHLVADEILDGVLFKVTLDEDKLYSVEVDPESASWFSQFNEVMFLKKMVKRVAQHDFLQCSHQDCYQDVAVDPWNEEWRDGTLWYIGDGWADEIKPSDQSK